VAAELEQIRILLRGLRESFLDEMGERCNALEALVLHLEASPDDAESRDELLRAVHSLKGTGGTHGIPVISSVCHVFETFLAADRRGSITNRALAYIDLLRRIEPLARAAAPDYSDIEVALVTLAPRKAGLVAEASVAMLQLYQLALAELPVDLTHVGAGRAALEALAHRQFDFAIFSGTTLADLGGLEVCAALRASAGPNRDIPVLLVTTRHVAIPPELGAITMLERNQTLPARLAVAVQKLVNL